MSGFNVNQPIEKVELEAVIIRADGTTEDLGTIAVWHKNPFKRFWANLINKGKIKVHN